MAGLKEIRRRISTVQNTKQITRAMKLVSAAKLRRAQQAAQGGRAYLRELERIIRQVFCDTPSGFSHALVSANPNAKAVRAVVIAGDRGLCGGYNANVLKAVAADESVCRANGVPFEVVALGRRVVQQGKRLGWNLVDSHEGLPEDGHKWPIEQIFKQLETDFLAGRCKEIRVYYTEFVSALSQKAQKSILLPFRQDTIVGSSETVSSVPAMPFKYSPQPEELLRAIIPSLVMGMITQAALDAKASEHASRMTAMESATRNAEDLISKLKLHYNRARQSTITKELLDIIGGAEAIQ